MKATELRTGNHIGWYSAKETELIKDIETSSFSSAKINGVDISDCRPIPLTQKRLEDFGFRKDSGYWYGKSIDKINSMLINYKTGSVVIVEKSGQNAISLCNVKYIHSLQNLWFALTREELTKNF